VNVDRNSIVCIANRNGLDGPGIESRLEARISAPVQIGPWAQPASYTVDTGSFPGVEPSGHDGGKPPPIQLRGQGKSKTMIVLPLWVFVACSRVNFTFFTLDMKIKQEKCIWSYMNMLQYKRGKPYTCTCFGQLIWPSSGRCFTKDICYLYAFIAQTRKISL
jgi:hypothetical protein